MGRWANVIYVVLFTLIAMAGCAALAVLVAYSVVGDATGMERAVLREQYGTHHAFIMRHAASGVIIGFALGLINALLRWLFGWLGRAKSDSQELN